MTTETEQYKINFYLKSGQLLSFSQTSDFLTTSVSCLKDLLTNIQLQWRVVTALHRFQPIYVIQII